MPKPEVIRLTLSDGLYIADLAVITAYLETHTKRSMVRECREQWPELFRDGSWSYAGLMKRSAFVLAVILNQDDDAAREKLTETKARGEAFGTGITEELS